MENNENAVISSENGFHEGNTDCMLINGRYFQKATFVTHVTNVAITEPPAGWDYLDIRSKAKDARYMNWTLRRKLAEAGTQGLWVSVTLDDGDLPTCSVYPICGTEGTSYQRICVPLALVMVNNYSSEKSTNQERYPLHHPNVIFYDVGSASKSKSFLVTTVGSVLHGIIELSNATDSPTCKKLDKFDPNNGWIFYQEGSWWVTKNGPGEREQYAQLFLPEPIYLNQEGIIWDSSRKILTTATHGLRARDENTSQNKSETTDCRKPLINNAQLHIADLPYQE